MTSGVVVNFEALVRTALDTWLNAEVVVCNPGTGQTENTDVKAVLAKTLYKNNYSFTVSEWGLKGSGGLYGVVGLNQDEALFMIREHGTFVGICTVLDKIVPCSEEFVIRCVLETLHAEWVNYAKSTGYSVDDLPSLKQEVVN